VYHWRITKRRNLVIGGYKMNARLPLAVKKNRCLLAIGRRKSDAFLPIAIFKICLRRG
jgi:hypothetical protein